MQDCKHLQFESKINVTRLTSDNDPKGDPTSYMAEVHIRCADCMEPFLFRGLSRGLAVDGAAMSFDEDEARLAILPMSTVNILNMENVPVS